MSHSQPSPLLDRLAVFALLRSECAKAGGQQAWAQAHGIAPTLVSASLHAARENISPSVLAALGLVKVERYLRLRPQAPTPEAPADE